MHGGLTHSSVRVQAVVGRQRRRKFRPIYLHMRTPTENEENKAADAGRPAITASCRKSSKVFSPGCGGASAASVAGSLNGGQSLIFPTGTMAASRPGAVGWRPPIPPLPRSPAILHRPGPGQGQQAQTQARFRGLRRCAVLPVPPLCRRGSWVRVQLPSRRCGRREQRQEMIGTAALCSPSCEAPALPRRRQEVSACPGG